MPTVGWIQETAIDLYYERGSSSSFVDLTPPVYLCRHCGVEFSSCSERDWHEIEHPIANPVLLIAGREVQSATFKLSHRVRPKDIEAAFVEQFVVNHQNKCDLNDLRQQLGTAKQQFFHIELHGKETKKSVSVDIQIAEPGKLAEVDTKFRQWFSEDDFSGDAVTRFIQDTDHLQGCVWYRDGLVKYIQGVMAKDHRADLLNFESFSARLNQSFSLLSAYDTPLAISLCQMIKFIMNDFRLPSKTSFIPALDIALKFFNKELSMGALQKLDGQLGLPIDYASEIILNQLVGRYQTFSFDELVKEIKLMNRTHLSLQDKQKLDYLCYRKAEDEANPEMVKYYARRVKHVIEFSEQFTN
ncbi:hypothetical protein [Shewanella sp. 10N.286.52.B9]|uniref:hypothetical protein n=1 Tax=Shewanella sp. 10N.286.52.B9 TaxID=1880837 RepID=UPI000C822659|nr:hypothetical protein [Shewanella sp. 10N.286.52.B9]PMG50701.1 hypothetical protein BCU91_17275 [Shewanella sp. 10N.286.52.B9]